MRAATKALSCRVPGCLPPPVPAASLTRCDQRARDDDELYGFPDDESIHKPSLQAANGPAKTFTSGFETFNSAGNSYIRPDPSDSWRIRATDHRVVKPIDHLSFGTAFVYQYTEFGDQGPSQNWLSGGVRPVWHLTESVSIALGGGVDWISDSPDGQSGTLDGANVEIREEVGAENFFLFGLDAAQVQALRSRGYQPRQIYQHNAALREVLDFIASGALANGDANLFRPLVDNLLDSDPFLVLADYQAYVECQQQVSALWLEPQAWTRMAILNVARMGKFSSDRSIHDYCAQVWRVMPVAVSAEPASRGASPAKV